MKITFLGATQTVTGSRFLLEASGKKVLMDCGMYQGLKKLRLRNWEEFPIDIDTIDAVVLTHAHVDHSGYLPALYAKGYRGPIYSSQATKALCAILLPDAGYLQEEETRYALKKGFSKHKDPKPLFTEEDGKQTLELFKTCGYNEVHKVADEFNIVFRPVGHILGASCIEVQHDGKSVLFSGDLGREHDAIMPTPSVIDHNIDYLVMESTYGNRLHEKTDPKEKLKNIINRTIERRGVLVIPSFAVGRTQTVLHFISELKKENAIADVPVYLNSPMAIEATQTFSKFKNETKLSDDQAEELCHVAKFVHTPEQSKALNQKEGPMIIISASGMATGGRVLHHLKAFVGDPKNTILFMGFQAAGTRGEALLNHAERIKIHGEYHVVRAEIDSIESLSAHADYEELCRWVEKMPNVPKQIYLVHGEPSAQDNLRRLLTERLNVDVKIPEYKDSFEI